MASCICVSWGLVKEWEGKVFPCIGNIVPQCRRGQCLEGEGLGGHHLGDKADIDDCPTEGGTLERGW